MRIFLVILICLNLLTCSSIFSQVNFFDKDDTEFSLSYYEKEFGGNVEKVLWEFESGMIGPEYCNAGAIIVFNTYPKKWIALYVNLDRVNDRIDLSDVESIEDGDEKYRIQEERFTQWKESIYSMPLTKTRSIVDSILIKGNGNIVIDSIDIPEMYTGDEGEIIGVIVNNTTREFDEHVWYDVRMKVGRQRSKGYGLKFPKDNGIGMLDSITIQSITHIQHPKCDSNVVNGLWWINTEEQNYYSSYSVHFEYLISQYLGVFDFVGCGDVFFAKCNDGNSIGWYKFSAEHPEGEYLDIPVSSKLMNRIVGGDSYFDDFESYVIIENPKALSAYFFDKNEYFSFPKGYTLLSNNEYESVIVKKGKKKSYFNYDPSNGNDVGSIEAVR